MKKIAIFVYEGISLFHLSVASAIFVDANPNGRSQFEVTYCGEQKGEVVTSSQLKINVENTIEAFASADILIFPSWDPNTLVSERLTKVIKDANRNEKVLVGLCLGAFVLAHSGILNHKPATTHWAYGDVFKKRFADVLYNEDQLYIKTGNIVTSAGTAAAIDCCLYLLKELHGAKTANQVSRMMVSAPHRAGGQKQFLARPMPMTSSDKRVNQLIETIMSDLSKSYTLDRAAELCFMSRRTFSRMFKLHFSMSFNQWLKQTRLNYAQELLESSLMSITQIAEKSGFLTEQNFRKQFKLTYAVTPKEWRQNFQAKR